MAAEAVASVVIQKVTNLLIQESVIFDKVIDRVEDIRIDLRTLRSSLIDAEDYQKHGDNAKNWVNKCLSIVYHVEDIIESYVLALACRKREMRFFKNYGLVFHDLRGCKNLRRKMDEIGKQIKLLKNNKPQLVQIASIDSVLPEPYSVSRISHNAKEEEEEDKEEEDKEAEEGKNNVIEADSSPTVKNYDGERMQSGNRVYYTGLNLSPKTYGERTKKIVEGQCVVSYLSMSKLGSNRNIPFEMGPCMSFRESKQLKRMPSVYEEEDPGKRDSKDLVERLITTDKDIAAHEVILVRGPAGSGKTTLVRSVYSHRDIKLHFACRAWVYVREDYSMKDLLLHVLSQVKKSKERSVLNEDQLKKQLSEVLRDQKYLIVFDNVRTIDVWNSLKDVFPYTGKGSRLLFTIPDTKFNLPNGERSRSWNLRPLNKQDSWDLFWRELCLGENSLQSTDPDLFHFQRPIIEKCQGLPLNLVLLGGLLSTKKVSSNEWIQFFSQASWLCSDVLSLSYNDLPVHSKLCLLYLTLFPKESDISVRRLFRLWVAEGFIRRSPGMTEEDLAEEYFNDFVNRNLVKISKFRSDGSPRRCHLPGVLHEFLSPKAQDISLFHVHCSYSSSPSPPPFGVRRVVEVADIKSYAPADSGMHDLYIKNVRSYLSFNFQRNDTPAKEVGNFISKTIGNKGFGLLRVLDLEGVYKPRLPDTLKHLFHLRYLGLRWTFLDTLPQSVGDLPYLETLDLKRTYINSLPGSIWKLEHLRHLNLPEIRLDMPVQQPSSQLLTLWGLIIDDSRTVEKGLSGQLGLRELGVTCRMENFDELMNWIAKLSALRSLRLRSIDEMGRPSKLSLKPLPDLGKLSHLSLLGHMDKLLIKDDLPQNLKVLTLSVTRLNEDPMRILSQLPSLSVLRLLADSFLGEKMECPQKGFSNLCVLKLWMLKELKEWTVKEGAMPYLKELNIRCCLKLEMLPPALLNLSTLEEVVLTSMPNEFVANVNEFVANVKQNKSKRMIVTDNQYNFTPLPWEQDKELWKEP